MSTRSFVLSAAISIYSICGVAAPVRGDPEAGRQLVLASCIGCHALTGSNRATDGAPPLSFLAKDNRARPAWVRGWLMDPHPPMPTIALNRAQIDNIVAYLNTLASD